jgi:PAS domain-containing protein
MPDLPTRRGPRPRTSAPPARRARPSDRESVVADDEFFRDLTWSLRNGVLAVTRDGAVAVMNDAAYQILGLTRQPTDIGSPFAAVLKDHQDVCRIVTSAFELSHLPNRAELRL